MQEAPYVLRSLAEIQQSRIVSVECPEDMGASPFFLLSFQKKRFSPGVFSEMKKAAYRCAELRSKLAE
jgi:hypothetical protein